MALLEELSSLKMKEGEGVAAYWARADDLRSKYFAAGGKEEVEEWMMRVLKGLPPHFEMLKVVLNNQSPSLTKDQLLTSLRSEEMRIGVAPRSDGVATFGVGTKVGSSGRGNGDNGRKLGCSSSSSDTNSGRWGQGKGKVGVLDFPWGSKGMAPRRLCHGCWDEGHAWQRCPHRSKGGIPAFLKRGGRGSNGKAQVADEEEQDDKANAVVREAVAAVGEEQVTHNALPASITPMEAWSGQKPHVGMARIWGCMGSVMLHGHEKGGKLDARAVMCVCVGVDMESKGWRMLDPSLMRIHIARDVDLLENVMWKDWDKAKGFGELLQDAVAISQLLPLPLSPPSAPADDVEIPPSSLPLAPLSVSVQQQPTPLQQLSGPSVIQRRSATHATSSSSSSGQRSVPLSTGAPPSPATTSPPPVTGLQVLGIQSDTGGEEVGGDAGVVEGMLCLAREVEGVALAGVSTGDVPRTLAEALRGPEGPAWKAGAEKEINAMRIMGVWDPEPVDLPLGKKAIGVRYVFSRKTDKEDKVVQHKVRLVAKGYTQEPEKDYDQVFAPVGKLTSGRVLLAEAAVKGWHVQQEDVDHAYLNAVLQEEVYVRQPEGFDDGTGRAYRLRKALYGLKQAPRAWNEEIGTTLIAAGFDRSACDEALYIRFVDEEPVYVLVYVDDLLLVSPRLELIGQVKEVLAQRYQMKDLGEVSTYLCVEVRRSVKDGWLEIG
ncbi:unnamed protein product [Closterium sp. NIES-54]